MSDDNDLVAQANRVLAMERERRRVAAVATLTAHTPLVTKKLLYREDGDPVAYSGHATDIPADVAAKMWDEIAATAEQQVQNQAAIDRFKAKGVNQPKPLKRIDKIAKY